MNSNPPNATDNPRDTLDPIAREAQDWVLRFAAGEATPDDLRRGKQWCDSNPAHAAAFLKASRIWEGLGPEVFEPRRSPQRALGSSPVTRRAVLGGAVAASAAYLVVRPPLELWPSWSELTADYRTQTGERRRVAVTDGVVVEMNTQTSISLRLGASNAAGIALISGEAVIATTAATTAPFSVAAGGGQAEASRAKFNVRNDGGAVCVTCVEGDVRVAYGAAEVLLRPREQVGYDRLGLGNTAPVDPAVVTAWQDDQLIFHAQPLREVVAEINRYRSGKIILVNSTLGGRLFSANFRVRNVDAMIEQVQRLFGATVKTLPGGIVLLG